MRAMGKGQSSGSKAAGHERLLVAVKNHSPDYTDWLLRCPLRSVGIEGLVCDVQLPFGLRR